jgi:pimeloyl-ACP methyl ester carboxylesterase
VRTFSRGGIRLAYDDTGTGFPVVLHTGGAGSSSMWRDGGYVDRLSGFRTLSLDHRGRGASDRPRDLAAHRLDAYVDDVKGLVDDTGCDRFAFVGYSFGGLVGLVLAAREPRLAGLVALGAVFDPPDTEPTSSAYPSTGGMAALVSAIEREEQMTVPGWLRDDFMTTDADQFELTIEANAGDTDPWEVLPLIRCPTVLIAGTLEDPDLQQDRMAAQIEHARSVHLKGAGHVGTFLRPDEVTDAALPTLVAAAGG